MTQTMREIMHLAHPEREWRKAWLVDPELLTVERGDAFSCAPESPEMWWVPSKGFTLRSESLFETEKDATQEAALQCARKLAVCHDQYSALLDRYQELKAMERQQRDTAR